MKKALDLSRALTTISNQLTKLNCSFLFNEYMVPTTGIIGLKCNGGTIKSLPIDRTGQQEIGVARFDGGRIGPATSQKGIYPTGHGIGQIGDDRGHGIIGQLILS